MLLLYRSADFFQSLSLSLWETLFSMIPILILINHWYTLKLIQRLPKNLQNKINIPNWKLLQKYRIYYIFELSINRTEIVFLLLKSSSFLLSYKKLWIYRISELMKSPPRQPSKTSVLQKLGTMHSNTYGCSSNTQSSVLNQSKFFFVLYGSCYPITMATTTTTSRTSLSSDRHHCLQIRIFLLLLLLLSVSQRFSFMLLCIWRDEAQQARVCVCVWLIFIYLHVDYHLGRQQQ